MRYAEEDERVEYGSVRADDEPPALVFAGDGGGHLFAVAGSGRVWRSATASWSGAFEVAAVSIQEFLEQVWRSMLHGQARRAVNRRPG
ncbi:hypothetical protein C3492_32320 [Streptomyces sp. Ru62]|nr:hypothetical protein C3492_32320 [Streptomyces sp. Ru62]